jgi:hypothetical protein
VRFRERGRPFFFYAPESSDFTISDRRRVRAIGPYYAKIADWELVEGCSPAQTDPAVYRASLVTGRTKQVETGVTCDGEKY